MRHRLISWSPEDKPATARSRGFHLFSLFPQMLALLESALLREIELEIYNTEEATTRGKLSNWLYGSIRKIYDMFDSKRSSDSSVKLDVLLEQLREVLDEGHKALVFSQFTSLLKILRARLNQDGMLYEYLDGATRDRQTRVERFQNDKDCRLFLVSLKAGGLGLNLTAAEYVFILDPW
jgi:SNF2 family DNA or RNA helicase